MSMDKRWKETFERLDRIEAKLGEPVEATLEVGFDLPTKEELMKINGVGSSLADKILELLNS